jgi:hypothetical protein
MSSNRQYGPSGAPTITPNLAINTVAASVSSPVLPAQLVGNTTSEQVVQNPAITTTATPVALVVQIPSKSEMEQLPFEIQASGYIATGANATVTAKLYSGTSTTPGSNTLLGSSGAVTQNTAKAPFWAHAKLIFDSVSGKLGGTVDFLINNTVVASVAISNVVTGISDTANPVASFCISFTFSAANASNLVNVQEFAINF